MDPLDRINHPLEKAFSAARLSCQETVAEWREVIEFQVSPWARPGSSGGRTRFGHRQGSLLDEGSVRNRVCEEPCA